MTKLFQKTVIKDMKIANRMIRSATWEGMCDQEGKPTEKLINCYQNLARGGIGLIISGYTFISVEGKQLAGMMGIHRDDFDQEYKRLTKVVHENGGKIVLQLVHTGGQANSVITGRQPVAPSAVQTAQFPEIPVQLTKEKIFDIVTTFSDGARRARDYGFDAVQLHGAHGYLINQFLSPLTNQRSDEYGGSIKNRCRFMTQVYHKVRDSVGADYPVFIKLNVSDNLDGGLEIEDGIIAAKTIAEAGIDAIELSSGTSASGGKGPVRRKINKPEREAYNLEAARRIRKVVDCPLMVVGGFRSFEVAEKSLTDDEMDYISLSRPLIREPGLANRWLQGDRSPAKCISCSRCFVPGFKEGGIYCVTEQRLHDKAK